MTKTEFLDAQELANLAAQLDSIGRQILIAFGNGIVAGRQSRNEAKEDNHGRD